MFSKETIDKNRAMVKDWYGKIKDLIGEGRTKSVSDSGIELKPVYTPEDIKEIKYEDIGLPGEYPYIRGCSPMQYQTDPFIQYQFFGFGSAEDTRKRRDWLAQLGCSYKVGREEEMPLLIAFDLPTLKGFEPDEPECRGRVGQGGISISTVEDVGFMMDGLPLDKTWVIWNAFDASMPMHALYFVYAMDVRKVPLEKILVEAANNVCNQWAHDWIGFPPKTTIKLEVELLKFIVKNCPLSYHTGNEGYESGEAGATAIQAVAFMLAHAICVTEECIKVGLDPDEVVAHFVNHHYVGLNFFEDIAKIRATRGLWAKIFKERFGCKNPESLKHRVDIAETAGHELTALEPLNNIVRLTIGTLAGILAGVEGLFTAAYDEAVGIPTAESAQLAVRTQQILAQETDVCKVNDPLGGSYYIEWLTKRIEEEISNLLKRMDEKGGFIKCQESGWIRAEIARSANERQRAMQNGEKVIIGVNKYKVEDEAKLSGFRLPPEVEEGIKAKVRKYKEGRDKNKIRMALADVREAALKIEKEWPESCGVLMPALMDATRAGCTLGEMHKVLREVFGYGFYSG